ncbi:MAG: hypothetical protein FD174_409 [Geobacteraceae bacterium]|nr:MAG: hypothetical protein FD174_409 [Geobacteraceae bacterium]
MEISSVASQASAVKEQMSEYQLGIAAIKQAADTEKQVADTLAKNATTVPPAKGAEEAGFSTYA